MRSGAGGGAGGGIGLGRFGAQNRIERLGIEHGKTQHPAARTDCGQQPAQPVGHQQEEGADGRFLQAFQQRIDRVLLEVVCRVDDHHPALAQRRPGGQAVLQRADFVDRDRALAAIVAAIVALLGLFLVLGRVVGNENVGVGVGGRLRHAGGGNQLGSGGAGESALAGALQAGEDPRVVHPVRSGGGAPFAPRLGVAGQHQAVPR